MEYLQYKYGIVLIKIKKEGFKPYYKWNTFNTLAPTLVNILSTIVLNLIINGIPSIL